MYAHKRIALDEMMLVTSPRGKEFQASIKKDKWINDLPTMPQDQVQRGIENLQKLLARDQFSDIEKEYMTFSRPPHWYQLFGGPSSIQQLAYELKHHAHYDFLYRQWSTVAHAHDFSKFLSIASTGESGIRGMTAASPLP